MYEIEVLVASLLLHPKIEGLSLGKLLACVAYSKTLINHEQYCFVFRKERPVQFFSSDTFMNCRIISKVTEVVRLIKEKKT